MALFDWFGSKGAGDNSTESKAVAVEESLSGLNLKQVLEAHQAWKGRLQKVLDNTSDERFDLTAVSQDNHCFLGKWIYSEGKNLYGHLPEYETVRKAHVEFHVCAGEVLTQHKIGNEEKAQELLKTKFRSASNLNQMELTKLFGAAKTR